MAKTKPIGVRFNEDIFDKIKKEQNLKTPQQVLSWLEENYGNVEKYKNVKPEKKFDKPLLAKPSPPAATIFNSKSPMPKGLSLQEQIDWKIKHEQYAKV